MNLVIGKVFVAEANVSSSIKVVCGQDSTKGVFDEKSCFSDNN